MGRTIVKFELANYRDLEMLEEGLLTPDKVRRIIMDGVVDTGAARLVLPESVVKLLGLPVIGQSNVRYADHHREVRDVVKNAYVQILGRGGPFNAIVEPSRTDALLGAIVLEDLDLLVDCTSQRLIPRESDRILTEVE